MWRRDAKSGKIATQFLLVIDFPQTERTAKANDETISQRIPYLSSSSSAKLWAREGRHGMPSVWRRIPTHGRHEWTKCLRPLCNELEGMKDPLLSNRTKRKAKLWRSHASSWDHQDSIASCHKENNFGSLLVAGAVEKLKPSTNWLLIVQKLTNCAASQGLRHWLSAESANFQKHPRHLPVSSQSFQDQSEDKN